MKQECIQRRSRYIQAAAAEEVELSSIMLAVWSREWFLFPIRREEVHAGQWLRNLQQTRAAGDTMYS